MGVRLAKSSNCSIYGNTIKDNRAGISILGSSRINMISENIIQDNDEGVYFATSQEGSSNTFRNNELTKNGYNIRFYGYFEGDPFRILKVQTP